MDNTQKIIHKQEKTRKVYQTRSDHAFTEEKGEKKYYNLSKIQQWQENEETGHHLTVAQRKN